MLLSNRLKTKLLDVDECSGRIHSERKIQRASNIQELMFVVWFQLRLGSISSSHSTPTSLLSSVDFTHLFIDRVTQLLTIICSATSRSTPLDNGTTTKQYPQPDIVHKTLDLPSESRHAHGNADSLQREGAWAQRYLLVEALVTALLQSSRMLQSKRGPELV